MRDENVDRENWDTDAVNPEKPVEKRKVKMVKVPELLKTRGLMPDKPKPPPPIIMPVGPMKGRDLNVGCLLFLIPFFILGYFV